MKDMNVSDLEKYLAGLRVSPSAELDESVRRMADEAEHAGENAGKPDEHAESSRAQRLPAWLLRVAACVVLICAIAFAVWLAGSNRLSITPSAYAQVEEALANSKAANWAHARGTVSGEAVDAWGSLAPFRSFTKSSNGVLEVADLSAGRRYEYNPITRTITVSQITEKLPAEWAGKQLSFFDMLEDQIKTMQAQGKAEITSEQKKMDGKTYIVLKMKVTSGEGGWMSGEFVIDSLEKRIIQYELFDPQSGKSAGILHFDYPAVGPEDIYALGAPKDAKVVNAPAPPPAPVVGSDVKELQKAVVGARDRFAPTYCATVFEGYVLHNGSLQPQQVDVVYKKNGHWRLERYIPSDARGYVLSPGFFRPDDMNSIMDWAKGQRPRQVAIMSSLDEDYEHRDRGVVFSIGKDGGLEKTSAGNIVQNTPEFLFWNNVIMSGGAHALLPSRQGNFGQLTLLERTDQAYMNGKGWIRVPQRGQWAVNASRDYIVEEYEFDSNPDDAPWQVDKDWRKGVKLTPQQENRWSERRQVLEYAQTEQGQWYAKKILRNQDQMYIIRVVTTQEIPGELFDPEKVDPKSLDSRMADADRAFDQAIAEMDRRANWPSTPEEVAREYWAVRNAKNFKEMAVLWPGSALWNESLRNEKPVQYVFGEAQKQPETNQVIVPYAAKEDYDRNGKYNVKMRLANKGSAKGRYYIVSGN